MSRPILATLTLALFLASVPACAQDIARPEPTAPQPPSANEPEISLDELVQRALDNNPQPAIARANLEAARQRAGALSNIANPILQAIPATGGNYDSRNEELILSQPIDVFGQRRALRSVAKAEVSRAEAEAKLATRALIIEVRNAAASLFAAQEAETFGQSQYDLAMMFYNAANRRAQQGDVPQVQAQRAKLEVGRAANDLDNARAERLTRRAALNILVGQAPETPLRVTLPLPADWAATLDSLQITQPGISGGITAGTATAGVNPNREVIPEVQPNPSTESTETGDVAAQREQLLAGALSRPDILSAQATLAARQAQVNVIGRQRLPDFSVQMRRDGVIYSATGTSLRAVMNVPIFDFGSIKRDKRAAQAEVQAQEAQIVLLKQRAAAELEQALVRLQRQRATVERYRISIVPETLDLLRKTQIGYAQGASTYLEILEAQRSARQAQNEYLQAVVGVRTSEAAVEAAIGASLPTTTAVTPTNATPVSPLGVTPTSPPAVLPPNVTPIPQENR